MKSLREAEGFVRRDNKEYKARRNDTSLRGGRGRRRGFTRWGPPNKNSFYKAGTVVSNGAYRARGSPQNVTNKLSKAGRQLS